MCRIENKRLEGLGKAPALYPVLFSILDLVPKSFETRDFYVALFLFMLCTGQRYITICNIKLSDIKSVVFKGNKLSIKIICRITKANEDWNQPFILEGELEDNRIMNFVYWLNKFLINLHDLDLQHFDSWNKDECKYKYLWGRKNRDFKEKIPYSTVYSKWRYFYQQAGIPQKLLGIHSFRSGFYCQSLLNASIKGLDYNVMNELSMLLAGWRSSSDRATYNKNEMRSLITPLGVIENPSPEQMLGCDMQFESLWDKTKD
jgi:hypothetical protein